MGASKSIVQGETVHFFFFFNLIEYRGGHYWGKGRKFLRHWQRSPSPYGSTWGGPWWEETEGYDWSPGQLNCLVGIFLLLLHIFTQNWKSNLILICAVEGGHVRMWGLLDKRNNDGAHSKPRMRGHTTEKVIVA